MTSKFKFWDDPVTKIKSWLVQSEQNKMREVIRNKYKNVLDEQVYWLVGTDEENKGLSDDNIERMVQRLSLSQIGVFVAQRLWAKRTFIIFPLLMIIGFILSYILINKSGTTENDSLIPVTYMITLWFGVVLFFSATFFQGVVAQFLLPKKPIRQDEIDNVKNTISDCVIRNHDDNTPSDLSDRLRLMVTDAKGRAVAGQILATDLEYSALRAEWLTTKLILMLIGLAMLAPVLVIASPTWAVLGYYAVLIFAKFAHWIEGEEKPEQQDPSIALPIILYVVIPLLLLVVLAVNHQSFIDSYLGLGGATVKWIYVLAIWAIVGFYTLFTTKSPIVVRSTLLDQAVKETGTELLIDKAGRTHFQLQEQARIEQLNNAKKDTTPFLKLGVSTGLLAQRRDPLAPTEANITMGLSVLDLSTHIGVLGASGTGKTFSVVRPLTTQWINANLGGLLVLDGKGALPLEFEGANDYQLISPNNGQFNPIANMSADAVADVLADIFSQGDNDKFWSDSARLMLRMACIIIKAVGGGFSFNLVTIQKFCMTTHEAREEIIRKVEERAEKTPKLEACINYWLSEYPNMPEKTAGSISNMVRTWLGNILLHDKLSSWVDTEENTINIEDCLTGAKIGLLLPESEYGTGGIAISALCMRRLYDAVKKRGDTWKNHPEQLPVFLAADEVQNLLTKADLETVPVARSLGLYMMFATQNVDGLYKRLDKDGALQMLGNLASLVAFPPRTEDSNNYISKRCGKIWRTTTQSFNGLADAQADMGLYQNSGTDASLQATAMNRYSRCGSPRLSYAVGLWHREYEQKARGLLETLAYPDPNKPYQPTLKPVLQFELQPLIEPDEIDTLLSCAGTAIVVLNRGRVARRDIAKLGGLV